MKDDLQYYKWKTTSNNFCKWKMTLIIFKQKTTSIYFVNARKHHIFWQMANDFNFFGSEDEFDTFETENEIYFFRKWNIMIF